MSSRADCLYNDRTTEKDFVLAVPSTAKSGCACCDGDSQASSSTAHSPLAAAYAVQTATRGRTPCPPLWKVRSHNMCSTRCQQCRSHGRADSRRRPRSALLPSSSQGLIRETKPLPPPPPPVSRPTRKRATSSLFPAVSPRRRWRRFRLRPPAARARPWRSVPVGLRQERPGGASGEGVAARLEQLAVVLEGRHARSLLQPLAELRAKGTAQQKRSRARAAGFSSAGAQEW